MLNTKKAEVPASPTIQEVRQAARVIKEYCNSRNEGDDRDCMKCPIKDICYNEPFLWEV